MYTPRKGTRAPVRGDFDWVLVLVRINPESRTLRYAAQALGWPASSVRRPESSTARFRKILCLRAGGGELANCFDEACLLFVVVARVRG